MSNELDIKFPEIYYDGTKSHMYEYLKTEPESPFYDQTYATIFIFAMAFAKRKKLLPADLKKTTKMPPSAFDSKMRTLMRSIMISEKHDVYAIKDNLELRSMCQKYANAGIDKLYIMVKNRPLGTLKEEVLMDLINS